LLNGRFLDEIAMTRWKTPNSWIARENRRGCFVIAAGVLLLILALAYVGLKAGPFDDLRSSIPVLG
jgi:hypothetical protein